MLTIRAFLPRAALLCAAVLWWGASASAPAPTEIAQAPGDDILVEEESPEPAAPPADTARTPMPPAVKPPAAPPAPAAKKTRAATPAKGPVDARDLLIEEGETPVVEEAPAAPEIPPAEPAPTSAGTAAAPAPAAKAIPAPASGPAPAQPQIEDGGLVEEDSAAATLQPRTPAAAQASATTPAPRASLSEIRSINFAENLKQYRSPKLAMLLSLVVPGLGQAYTRSWWKTGVFLAVEAAAIATSIGFYNKGKRIEKKAFRFADEHYSVDNFSAYYDSLWHAIALDSGGAYADSIFENDIFVFYDTSFDTASFRRMYEKRNSSDVFYSYLQEDKFIYGWEDAYPSLGATGQRGSFYDRVSTPSIDTAYASGDTLIMTSAATADSIDYKYDMYVDGGLAAQKRYGFSQYYNTYNRILRDRTKQHQIAGSILYIVLLNHIVSAIDAGLTAKAHNDRLLGKESLWQRIHVDPAWVDAGAGAVLGASVTLDF